MNRFRHSGLVTALFAFVLLITLSLFLALGLPTLFQPHWWISLASLLLVELTAYIYSMFWARNNNQVNQQVPGYLAIGTVIGLYAAVVIANILLFWLVWETPIIVYLTIQIITAALAAIGVIIAIMTRNYINDQDTEVKNQTELMQQIELIVSSVAYELSELNHTELADIKRKVIRLEEQVKYSDPVSHPSIVPLEESMLWQATELQRCVLNIRNNNQGDYQTELPYRLIQDILSDLNKRNQQLLTLK
ncbi:hypothetical protein [Paenibacillus marinisediminis]